MSLIIGTLGATLILLAFMLNNMNKLTQEDIIYDSLNFFGSLLLLMSALLTENIPFVVLNAVWAIVSLRDIYLTTTKDFEKKTKRKKVH